MDRNSLQESQAGDSRPVLEVIRYIEMKEDSKGAPVFQYWNGEKNVQSKKPIEGVFIGSAMKLFAFKDTGSYRSDVYWTKKEIKLYEPRKGGFNLAIKGNMEEIEEFVRNNATGNPRKVKVIFILTDDGLISVDTNLTIALDQLAQNSQGTFIENLMKLTPTIYDSESPKIRKKAKDILGKFASKNPPKYAEISIGEVLTDETYEAYNVEKVATEFKEWKEWKTSDSSVIEEKPKESPAFDVEEKFKSKKEEIVAKSKKEEDINLGDEDSDDLPF